MTTEGRTDIDPAIRAYIDQRLAEIGPRVPENRVTMVVFSGDLDRQLSSLVIATGAAAMGLEVSIFYTFWGLSALRREVHLKGKSFKQKMLAIMTPGRLGKMPVSRLNFGGIGRAMLKAAMKDQQVASVDEFFAMAREMGVTFIACTMSMEIMGISQDELIEGVSLGGVATFLGDAARSRVSLFI